MKTPQTSTLLLLALVGAFGMACCHGRPTGGNGGGGTPPIDVKKSEEIRTRLVEWLECEECTEGELEALTAFGREVVPMLAKTLVQGPAPASRELLRRDLVRRYHELQRYAATHPEEGLGDLTESEFVDLYLGNYVALYRVRAAQALGAIGGPEAERTLQSALQMELRKDVAAAVREAAARKGSEQR